jgi:hypothetical protein
VTTSSSPSLVGNRLSTSSYVRWHATRARRAPRAQIADCACIHSEGDFFLLEVYRRYCNGQTEKREREKTERAGRGKGEKKLKHRSQNEERRGGKFRKGEGESRVIAAAVKGMGDVLRRVGEGEGGEEGRGRGGHRPDTQTVHWRKGKQNKYNVCGKSRESWGCAKGGGCSSIDTSWGAQKGVKV